MLNTTNGPQNVDPNPHRHIATTRIYDEDMAYEDEEPEILAVLPATGWAAAVGEELVALVAFVALDDGRMHGVAVGENGRIALTEDVEKLPAFSGYVQTNNDKENQ
jgi:hypothetical protein